MDKTDIKTQLCDQLETTDTSMGFLLLIIASVLLSYWSVGLQRKGLCLTIEGDAAGAAALPGVFPIKIGASALVVGALGYFFTLSLQACCRAAQGEDRVQSRSASMNLWASLLVLAAALIRLFDLNFVEKSRQSALLEGDTLPA